MPLYAVTNHSNKDVSLYGVGITIPRRATVYLQSEEFTDRNIGEVLEMSKIEHISVQIIVKRYGVPDISRVRLLMTT